MYVNYYDRKIKQQDENSTVVEYYYQQTKMKQ